MKLRYETVEIVGDESTTISEIRAYKGDEPVPGGIITHVRRYGEDDYEDTYYAAGRRCESLAGAKIFVRTFA